MRSSFSFSHDQNARARKSPSFQLRWLLLGVATATLLGCAGELGATGRHQHTALCAPGWCCRGDHLWRSRKVRDRDATLAVHRPRFVAEQIDLLRHAPWCDGQISSYRSRQGWITRLHIVQACAINHHATPGRKLSWNPWKSLKTALCCHECESICGQCRQVDVPSIFGEQIQTDAWRLRPAGGVKHSDSELFETRMLSAKKALRWIEGSILSNSRKF